MKGCPEGSEQSFLFGLYSQLSEGVCPCPNDCGTTVPRSKSDFFAIFVRSFLSSHLVQLILGSQTFLHTYIIFVPSSERHATAAKSNFVLHAGKASTRIKYIGRLPLQMTILSSTAPIFKE